MRHIKTRRRLVTVTRKRITSYYTPEEQHEIASAADKLRISISSFVASAALAQARRVNSNQSSNSTPSPTKKK
jgi:uncharacterized protein (DUF1778 family)